MEMGKFLSNQNVAYKRNITSYCMAEFTKEKSGEPYV